MCGFRCKGLPVRITVLNKVYAIKDPAARSKDCCGNAASREGGAKTASMHLGKRAGFDTLDVFWLGLQAVM